MDIVNVCVASVAEAQMIACPDPVELTTEVSFRWFKMTLV